MPVQIDLVTADVNGNDSRGSAEPAAATPATNTALADQLRALIEAEQRRAERLAAD